MELKDKVYQLTTYNAIAAEGMERFERAKYAINENDDPDALILRSKNLHDMTFNDSLKAIARAGAGTNNIPTQRATEAGIVVFNTPGANANAVKELVLANLLLSVRPILQGHEWIQNYKFGPDDDVEAIVEANKKQFAGNELEGKKLGIIGLGAIGAMIANDAYRLGIEVYGYDPYVSVDTAWSISRRVNRVMELDDLLKICDFITVHVPLMDSTRGMIGERELAMMKEDVQLYNFARGPIVDKEAVLKAVNDNRIGGYTTDFADADLLHNEKIRVLPHLGASTEEAEINCARMAAGNLKRFLQTGDIVNSVNFPSVQMSFNSPVRITIINRNIPNMIGKISTFVAEQGMNIANMVNRGRGDFAYTLVDLEELDYEKVERLVARLEEIPDIVRVRAIEHPGQFFEEV
ncbi:D-3-phosphoglycerate dehydrogenase / 2-oxoglutarate reductase [Aerococcus sp. 150760007-1]|uniref:D-3-phosphoglycerate dehydrogenase n=1 Tax=Aerococcus urinaeequi TaxID=51665 RepID=A0ABR5ZZ13_9LACT|nr:MULTISPECIES: 3-phosphoglycerate dehydrogenase family protein [Lactobacillales]KAF3302828.1 3-phosphoglycerate dehydrogenase [Carnobacterium sp. PL12RED10]MBA5746985.1 3-phosphoglycerate dehydrogenase [Aerococcus urinaeequi]MBA5829769.1 3-phosphoglycerate dehydrogenase [Aerococcus urinaeequi]MBA5860757.1 3-phosphoglycerate dehydrogenase [Aerococcus urinaeequi]